MQARTDDEGPRLAERSQRSRQRARLGIRSQVGSRVSLGPPAKQTSRNERHEKNYSVIVPPGSDRESLNQQPTMFRNQAQRPSPTS